jgi:hypothetical protein
MGVYTVQFWGIDLTEAYDKIEKAMPSLQDDDDTIMEHWDDSEIAELSDYIRHHKLGESLYDGGGWGQITFIGKTIRPSKRGVSVTDDDVAEVEALIARIPDELKAALIAVHGRIPEPEFHTQEGWG